MSTVQIVFVRSCQGARLDRWMESDWFKNGKPADRFKNGKQPDRVKVVPKQNACPFCLFSGCFPHIWGALESRLVLRTVNSKCWEQREFRSPYYALCRVVGKRDTIPTLWCSSVELGPQTRRGRGFLASLLLLLEQTTMLFEHW